MTRITKSSPAKPRRARHPKPGHGLLSAEAFRHLKGDRAGASLIAAMQASPHRDIDIEAERGPMPVRNLSLFG
jgi:hypothetical protein